MPEGAARGGRALSRTCLDRWTWVSFPAQPGADGFDAHGTEDRERDFPHLTTISPRRAAGGVGLVVTGGSAPNIEGWLKRFAGRMSQPWHVRRHRQVTAAVHAHDAKICLQLLHAGRYAYQPLSVAPSRLKAPINPFTPRALSARGVERQIAAYATAAKRARDAGYDGVELMGSEGYLIIALREKIKNSPADKIYDIDLTYITSRGNWYYTSWKGDISKSGGIATNIGIHFFDMLTWIFGDVKENVVHLHTHDRASGVLRLGKANVRWFLSINRDTLPEEIREKGQTTYRSITIEGEEMEFSEGFTDLHTRSYEEILKGNGFQIGEARKSIEIVYNIRQQVPVGLQGDFHPFASKPLSVHPFSRLD